METLGQSVSAKNPCSVKGMEGDAHAAVFGTGLCSLEPCWDWLTPVAWQHVCAWFELTSVKVQSTANMQRSPSGESSGCVSIRHLWTPCSSSASSEGPGLLFKWGFLHPAAVQQQQKMNSSSKPFSQTCPGTQQGSGVVINSRCQFQLLRHKYLTETECCACKHACNWFLPEDIKVDQTRGEVRCWCVHATALYATHGRLWRAYDVDGHEHNFNNATCLWVTCIGETAARSRFGVCNQSNDGCLVFTAALEAFRVT